MGKLCEGPQQDALALRHAVVSSGTGSRHTTAQDSARLVVKKREERIALRAVELPTGILVSWDVVVQSVARPGDVCDCIRITINSGAVECAPSTDPQRLGIRHGVPTTGDQTLQCGRRREEQGSGAGQHAAPPGGFEYQRDGVQRVSVAEVTKPLAPLSRICANSNVMAFDSEESYNLNKTAGRRTPLLHRRGSYVIKVLTKSIIAEKSKLGLCGRARSCRARG